VRQIDIIIPLFNESDCIPSLFENLRNIFQRSKTYKFYFIFINDGSFDDTFLKLHTYCKTYPFSCKLISLSRNFGHQAALTAGIKASIGDAAVAIDGDLQDPPELIFKMLEEWEKGYKVVYARRSLRKGESVLKKLTASIFYKIIKNIASIDIPQDTGDFRLMDRVVVSSLKNLPEKNQFIRGLVPWLGYSYTFVNFERQKRANGISKYSISKMVKLAVDGISSFSTFPIRLCTYLGITITSFALILGIKITIDRVFFQDQSTLGWSSIIVAILFFGGVNLLFMGIIGEYVGRIFDEVKGRPSFIIEKVIDFNND